jgi:hypothetical protein
MENSDVGPPIPDWIVGLALIILVTVPLFGAYLLENRRRSQGPSASQKSAYIHERSFLWGYFFGVVFGLYPTVLLAAVTKTITTGGARDVDPWATSMLIVFFLTNAVLGLLTCRLNRWAFTLLSLLTFNPVLWLINAIYGAKRWTWRAAKPRTDNDAPTPTTSIT